jgi:hypothetical protein
MQWSWCTIASIFHVFCACQQLSTVEAQILDKTDYIVGGFSTLSQDTFMAYFKPLFETYLNENVGVLYNPRINFHLVPFDFSANNRAKDMVNAGLVDFICKLRATLKCSIDANRADFKLFETDTYSTQMACFESCNGFSPIASQVHRIQEKESSAVGGLIVSRRTNLAVQNISDMKGKRVGVASVLAISGFILPWQVNSLCRPALANHADVEKIF